ncbi:DUF6049 family protein [Nocardiopsis sp. NRRL B-16309]|uniref:DUF6049 family protein n=1 Tax=Nocardiopsis sp. NRRL B-16309 TaxID=1519494 RepID=UPI00210191B5|nr:DUF6049 family protein [Nocardiopsis sp. NRRL B-16309]
MEHPRDAARAGPASGYRGHGIFGGSGRAPPSPRVHPARVRRARRAGAPTVSAPCAYARRDGHLDPNQETGQALRRIVSAAAVTAMTAALFPIPAALSSVRTEPRAEDTAEPLVVERITPDAVDDDSTLRVTGRVTNTTDAELDDVTVRLRYSRHPFSGRDELDEFASGSGWQPNAEGPEEDGVGALEPGADGDYSLSTPVDELGLSGYGVYPMVIEAVDGDGGVVGAQYTFLPFTGGDDVPSVDIAWVWPLVTDPQRADDDTFLSDRVSEEVDADGRLSRLLAAGAQTDLSFDPGEDDLVELLGLGEDQEETPVPDDPTAEETAEGLPSEEPTDGEDAEETAEGEDGDQEETGDGDAADEEDEEEPTRTEGVPITWAVDPGTLDDIVRAASDEYSVVQELEDVPAGTDPDVERFEADQSAQVWLREARRVLAQDTVVATPYASADLAALVHNDMGADAEAAVRVGREAVLRALAMEADGAYAVPPGGVMDEAVYTLLAEAGAERFVLREPTLPAAGWLSTTPTAQAPLPPVEGDAEGVERVGLVADDGLTDVLSAPTGGPGETALALQRFAAETAMIAGENAGDDRVVVASPEARWDPDPAFASGVLEASEELPWLSPERLDDVELADESEREDTRRGLTYPDAEEELSSTYLSQIQDVNQDVRLFNSVLVGGSDPFRPAVLRLESTYWRDRGAPAGVARSLVLGTIQEHREDVRIIPGEPVTLASPTGITGILVANDLEEETVYVHLSVYSANAERLAIGEYTQRFEIAPGAKTTVYVPLSARINGRTELYVSLQNTEGEPISSQDILIPVNATGLGTQALLISGIGLLILVVALAPRALRKWTRRQASRSAEEADGAAAEGADGGADKSATADGAENEAAGADEAPDGGAAADRSADEANGDAPADGRTDEATTADGHTDAPADDRTNEAADGAEAAGTTDSGDAAADPVDGAPPDTGDDGTGRSSGADAAEEATEPDTSGTGHPRTPDGPGR